MNAKSSDVTSASIIKVCLLPKTEKNYTPQDNFLSSAYTQPGMEQDVWATVLFYNKQSAIAFAIKEQVRINTVQRQHTYQSNRNVTAGLIKKWIYSLYLDGPRKWRARTRVLLEHCLNHLEPYRPRTNRKRERKIMRAQGRHLPEKNYRKAM